ncbi:MAG: ATP-binding protein, partial [Dehalococcoidia bacterium]
VGAPARDRSEVLIPETMPTIAIAVAAATLVLAGVALVRERRARRAAQIAQSRFLAMMEATGFGVLMLDASGRIAYANNAAADIVGHPVHSLVGQDRMTVLHRGIIDEPEGCPLQRALQDHSSFYGNDHFVDIRGNLVPVAVTTAPVSGTGPDGDGAALVFRDRSTEVSEERQRHDALSMISHELRSPLTSVVGFSNRLERSLKTGRLQVEGTYGEEITLLAQEARRMRDIVNVVLDVANLERQKEVEGEPVLLRQVVDEEADRLARERPGAAFTRTGEDDAVVESDERYARRIIQNLMENALKYAGMDAPVEVRIESERDGYAVRVRDRGPGIAPDDQERIFDRFYRAPNRATGSSGLGLGLFLSRRLSRRLGGTLSVKSELGEGSEFTLWLPLEKPDVLPREQAQEADRLIW